ncbi:MAG TPA: uracil-DNA glycosylase family protein [Allosphingosinicella sp.]|nr:uracil-DNA glycosylase family protein [Allosphingosinicella sp.]
MSSRWAESALSWWEEAGVDTIAGEAPRDWLAPPKPGIATTAAPVEAAPPAPTEALPGDLPAFQAWLAATDAIPFASPMARRAAPAGDPAAALMAIVDLPTAAGALFADEAGALVDRMLAAIGQNRETIYLAPFSPIRPPAGRIDKDGVDFLARAMRHHIGLVAPRALLIFGDSCSRALLGTTMTQARGRWHEVETPAGPIKAVVTIRPQELLVQPKLKTHAWADLQLLMEGLTS